MKWKAIDAFAELGAVTRNSYAWSAQSEDKKTTVLTLWADETQDDGRVVLADHFGSPTLHIWQNSPRNKARIRHLRDVWEGDQTFRVIMLTAKDTTANSRSTIGRWPDEHLIMHLEAFNPETGEFRARGTRDESAASDGRNGKYRPLFDYLSARSDASLSLSLAEIEAMVGPLPSAVTTSRFWANTQHHTRRRAWLEAGYHAFYQKRLHAVRFDRVATPAPTSSPVWTDEELAACVSAYHQLWLAQKIGVTLNKSALRRQTIATALTVRNNSAYEKRMQNISAILANKQIEWVKGYVPLANIGAARSRLERMIEAQWCATPLLHIVTNANEVRAAFRQWQAAILEIAQYEGRVGWIPDVEIAVASYGDAPDGELHNKAALGVDPLGHDWAVQINIPTTPSTENGLSAIARDALGARYLIRQGTLHENNQSPRVTADDFRILSGMQAADVQINHGPSKRLWYIVTPITDSNDEMRRNTARFVKICATLRVPEGSDDAQAKADAAELDDRFGRDEEGGSSIFWARGGSRTMRRRHGEVWKALQSTLQLADKELRKPSPARGYDTDGEIVGKDGSILIEIKTGASAIDVYTGTGQLLLYSKMLKRLDGHRKILLLPGRPQSALCAAIEHIDVELHFYDVGDVDDWTTATFSPAFLALCGID